MVYEDPLFCLDNIFKALKEHKAFPSASKESHSCTRKLSLTLHIISRGGILLCVKKGKKVEILQCVTIPNHKTGSPYIEPMGREALFKL
jgi:hypothetical protein